MRRFRLSAAAQADLADILAWSQEQFGDGARLRYEALMIAALRDIADEPERVGSIARPELGRDVRSWHLRLSRHRTRDALAKVHKPRHFVIYRAEPGLVVVARVLHDAMELARHLDAETDWD